MINHPSTYGNPLIYNRAIEKHYDARCNSWWPWVPICSIRFLTCGCYLSIPSAFIAPRAANSEVKLIPASFVVHNIWQDDYHNSPWNRDMCQQKLCCSNLWWHRLSFTEFQRRSVTLRKLHCTCAARGRESWAAICRRPQKVAIVCIIESIHFIKHPFRKTDTRPFHTLYGYLCFQKNPRTHIFVPGWFLISAEVWWHRIRLEILCLSFVWGSWALEKNMSQF